MKLKLIVVLLFLVTGLSFAHAHAIWIETNNVGVKKKSQDVNVYFGEFGSEKDTAAKWFSNLASFKLYVTSPLGKKQLLTTKQGLDKYTAAFVPNEDGIYTLSLELEVADLHRASKIYYYSNATVKVGESLVGLANVVDATTWSIKNINVAPHKNMLSLVQVATSKKPAANVKLAIIAPDGTKKEATTDASGNYVFEPSQTGRYMIESIFIDKKEGEHNGQHYTAIFHCCTYVVEVK